jgi:hypothetical protein
LLLSEVGVTLIHQRISPRVVNWDLIDGQLKTYYVSFLLNFCRWAAQK